MSGKLQTHPEPQVREVVPLQPWDSPGSCRGGWRGSSVEASVVWQLDGASWQEPDQTWGQERASCSPRNGRKAATLNSSGGGLSYCSGLSFQQAGTPTPAKERP